MNSTTETPKSEKVIKVIPMDKLNIEILLSISKQIVKAQNKELYKYISK